MVETFRREFGAAGIDDEVAFTWFAAGWLAAHAPTTDELFGPDFKKCPACRLIDGHPGPCASS